MDKLLETIRGEIGTCLEKAYHKISLSGAARMLYSNPAQMQEYANQVTFYSHDCRIPFLFIFSFYYVILLKVHN